MEPESANMPIDVSVLAVDFIGGLHSNACLQPACAWQSGGALTVGQNELLPGTFSIILKRLM